jgi:hypothetical protein
MNQFIQNKLEVIKQNHVEAHRQQLQNIDYLLEPCRRNELMQQFQSIYKQLTL